MTRYSASLGFEPQFGAQVLASLALGLALLRTAAVSISAFGLWPRKVSPNCRTKPGEKKWLSSAAR